MLDLKKLERELDEVLEKETEDSLRKWLVRKRNKFFYDNDWEYDLIISHEGIYLPSKKTNPKFYNNLSNVDIDISSAA